VTASNRPSILAIARSDPIGAGIIVFCVLFLMAIAIHLIADVIELQRPSSPPRRALRPLTRPPAAWLAAARPDDVLTIPGVPVAYWGNPAAPYGARVTSEATRFRAIVVHFTDETPVISLVKYGHARDNTRGGASFGYHIYIDPQGRVLQGAPLGVRTNHVKPMTATERLTAGRHIDGTNSIGVSLIGACRSPRLVAITYQCRLETPTAEQLAAGAEVVAALRKRFSIPCAEIYGHGDLQRDRKSFEGRTLSRLARTACSSLVP
jgi:N-acetylmuramoyl-L-alanine amidase